MHGDRRLNRSMAMRSVFCRLHHHLLALVGWTAITAAEESPLPDTRLGALPITAALPMDAVQIVELGRMLFFDPILSATRDVACASCHHPDHGWADGRATPLGVHAQGLGPERRQVIDGGFPPLLRNTPTILNAAFNGLQLHQKYEPALAPMFWDNRVQGLETQALVPIRTREEMRGDACSEKLALSEMTNRLARIPEYVARFEGAITPRKVAEAIAAYERTLITPDTPFDRFMRGDARAMNKAQIDGMEVFRRAGCALCHHGPMFSDFKLHAVGVTDSSSSRTEFRTPSLRNLKYTAPYMHHGGEPSLEGVLIFYDRLMDHVAEALDGGDTSTLPPLDPLLRHLNMQPEDHAPIAAFLEALNTDSYDRQVPDRVPSGLPVPGAK